MRVLVTGGAGYIGSVTVEHLLTTGHDVTVFDNLEYGHREALPPQVPLIAGDLRRRHARGAPEAVMQFTAYALVGESMKQPQRYFENNVTGGLNLLEGMRVASVHRIVFSSSCAPTDNRRRTSSMSRRLNGQPTRMGHRN